MYDTESTDTTMAHAFAQAGFDFDATTAIETDSDDGGPRALICENAAALRRSARARRVRPPRGLGRGRRARRRERGVPHHRRGRLPRRHPARRRAREPALGLRQHASTPRCAASTAPSTGSAPSCATSSARRTAPRSSPASSSSSPTARGTSATAATPSRRCATPPPTHYRAMTGDTWRPRHGSHTQPDRQADHRPPSTPATSSARGRTARPRAHLPRGHPRRHRRRQGRRATRPP